MAASPLPPVFEIISEQQGARRLLLRRLVNVAAEWAMLAAASGLLTHWRAWPSRLFRSSEPYLDSWPAVL